MSSHASQVHFTTTNNGACQQNDNRKEKKKIGERARANDASDGSSCHLAESCRGMQCACLSPLPALSARGHRLPPNIAALFCMRPSHSPSSSSTFTSSPPIHLHPKTLWRSVLSEICCNTLVIHTAIWTQVVSIQSSLSSSLHSRLHSFPKGWQPTLEPG